MYPCCSYLTYCEQVSLIVEADPEVLCEKRVQSAVEGRFCDSAISVREAALELVGRHIASHPDVGLKVVETELLFCQCDLNSLLIKSSSFSPWLVSVF